MESSVIFRSFNGAPQSVTHVQPSLEKLASIPVSRNASRRCLFLQKASLFPSVKSAKATTAITCDAVPSDNAPQGLPNEKNGQKSTFPNGFEALILDVCDETDITELKLKVGQFEMHIKRDAGSIASSSPIAPPPPPPPPVPSKPIIESKPSSTPQKSTPISTSLFSNDCSSKASKLAALEASGSNTYVLVSSPTVGLFRSGRTLKGKKQPPSCKEGDMIKEGQIIGFMDQFGTELPVRSDAAGEVLKVLYNDGEPVGYGDPLIAVLPSFPGIK